MQVVPRRYDSQRNNLIWSTTEIIDEQRDSKGNRKNTVSFGLETMHTMMKANI